MSGVPGLYAVRRVLRAACTASNRLGGNSLSDLLVFGRRAGEAAAAYAADGGQDRPPCGRGRPRCGGPRARAVRGPQRSARTPTRSTQDLQENMQDLVGIIRTEEELTQVPRADRGAEGARRAPRRRGRTASTTPAGTWRCDLRNMLIIVRVHRQGRAGARRSPAVATPATTSRGRADEWAQVNLVISLNKAQATGVELVNAAAAR